MPVVFEGAPEPSPDARVFWKALDEIAFGRLTADEARERAVKALNQAYELMFKPYERHVPMPAEVHQYVHDFVQEHKAVFEFLADHGND